MEEITFLINEKISMIEEFIALSLRREKVQYVASTLIKEAKELNLVMDKLQKAVKEDLEKVNENHGLLIKRMQLQQDAIIKYVLAERRRKMQEAELRDKEMLAAVTASNVPRTVEKMSANVLEKCMSGLKLHSNVFTPITLKNYKNSPMVKHRPINPIPFKFLDFEYRITVEQFESIPKYMRGRECIDDLRNFLDTVVVPCFNKKYQLIHRQRSTVRNTHDLELWKVYNQQASYVPGRNFITAGDISQQMHKMLDKKQQNRIVMLRHLGVLQEQRVGQTVCYIWNADAH
ncbi:spindle and kinetochore-associated protein 1-like [Rhagoletis pomonella]|uniref:spindle and kinetochore-associated protein 1-like n=1 Tax=Rhagoletis pomonella TaxID=28610 RepID=UPI001784A844|nr:spindle and kinetochore-associated protein 1-like [Rhagoletis pomonella]